MVCPCWTFDRPDSGKTFLRKTKGHVPPPQPLVQFFHLHFFFPLLFQGICPGNRLQEIRTYDSGCYSMSPASSPCPSSIGSSTMSLLNSSLSMTTSPSLSSQQESIYENTVHLAALQRQDSRRSWQLASSNNLNQVSGTEGVAATNCVGSSVAIRKSIN